MINDLSYLGIQVISSNEATFIVDAGVFVKDLSSSLQGDGVVAVADEDAQTLEISYADLEIFTKHWRNLPLGGVDGATIQHLILAVGFALAEGKYAEADHLLEQLKERASAPESWETRIAQVFLAGLTAQRMQQTTYLGNLYNQEDMLGAFNVLMNATPLITFGHHTVTQFLVDHLKDQPNLHIVDLGIGSGLQWLGFLDAIAQEGIKKIRITGTDLPITGDDPQSRIGDVLHQHAKAHGIELQYTHLSESLEDFDTTRLNLQADETVIFNNALVLHHLQESTRNDVLQKIYATHPTFLTLIEPDSEHHNPPFMPRLLEAMRHWGNVFDMFSVVLEHNKTERTIIEQGFFGREITNILSLDESLRFERHERLLSWIKRMNANGFVSVDLSPYQGLLTDTLEESFDVSVVQGALRLSWRNYPIIGVSVWTCNR